MTTILDQLQAYGRLHDIVSDMVEDSVITPERTQRYKMLVNVLCECNDLAGKPLGPVDNCPGCEGNQVEGGPVEIEDVYAIQDCSCLDCGKEWHLSFVLSDVVIHEQTEADLS